MTRSVRFEIAIPAGYPGPAGRRGPPVRGRTPGGRMSTRAPVRAAVSSRVRFRDARKPPAPVAQGIERSPPERKVARSNRAGRAVEKARSDAGPSGTQCSPARFAASHSARADRRVLPNGPVAAACAHSASGRARMRRYEPRPTVAGPAEPRRLAPDRPRPTVPGRPGPGPDPKRLTASAHRTVGSRWRPARLGSVWSRSRTTTSTRAPRGTLPTLRPSEKWPATLGLGNVT